MKLNRPISIKLNSKDKKYFYMVVKGSRRVIMITLHYHELIVYHYFKVTFTHPLCFVSERKLILNLIRIETCVMSVLQKD